MLCDVFTCIACNHGISILKNKKIKCSHCGLESKVNINNFSPSKNNGKRKIIIIKKKPILK